MDAASWVADYGLYGLAVAAFIGATFIPVSSEIAVVAALSLGLPAWQVLLSASAGNAAGATFDYGLGWMFSEATRTKLEGSRAGRRSLRWVEKYGKWTLFGSWLPVLGDPICLAAGMLRLSPVFFAAAGIGTRIGRYVLLIYLF